MLIEELNQEINNYFNENNELLLENFTNDIYNESDFSDVDKIINFINEPASTGKNNIIYKLSAAFNKCKYKGVPLQRYIFVESYKLMTKDSEKYNINRSEGLFVNDLYFHLMQYKGSNEKIKTLRYYLLMLNIIWMIDFKGSNIYFLIQGNYHDEYYNQLLFYLITRLTDKIEKTDYHGYSIRIVYSSYIYSDIMEYKFKNYNTIVNNIAVYKLLHKIYINNKGVDESKIRELLHSGITGDKHISNNYATDKSIDILVGLIQRPYSSEVDIIGISGYGDEDSGNNGGITEEKIESMSSGKIEQIQGSIEEVIKLFGGNNKDPYFFILYDIFFNKINTTILYQLKDFEENFYKSNKILSMMFDQNDENLLIKNKLLLNNLNYLEQSNIIKQKKARYSDEFKMIRSKF